jgi:hypothetical protein
LKGNLLYTVEFLVAPVGPPLLQSAKKMMGLGMKGILFTPWNFVVANVFP